MQIDILNNAIPMLALVLNCWTMIDLASEIVRDDRDFGGNWLQPLLIRYREHDDLLGGRSAQPRLP